MGGVPNAAVAPCAHMAAPPYWGKPLGKNSQIRKLPMAQALAGG